MNTTTIAGAHLTSEQERDLCARYGILAEVDRLAKAAAACFAEEFPGEELEGDWDSTAWEMDAEALKSTHSKEYDLACDDAGHDVAWSVYASTLHAEIERINEAS
jgi:hypothetical protein